MDPVVTQVPQTWRISDSDELLEAIALGSVRGGAMLRAQTAEQMDGIRRAIREVVAKYMSGDAFEVQAPAVVAAAVKP